MRISGGQFADQMTLPLRQAMAAVVWLEGRVPNVHKPHEASEAKAALTDADCVSQEILLTALREYFPEVALEAEEDTPAVKAFAANDSPHTVHVDPIDGTLRYLRRDGPYAIIVGLEYEARVEASLVAVPQENVLIRAVLGGGAEISLGGGPFAPALLQGSGTRVLVSHAVPERTLERMRARDLHPVLAAGGAIGVAPLLDATLGAVRVIEGPEGLSPRAWIAALAVQEAGGVVEVAGAPLPERYRSGESTLIVATTPEAADALRADL